MKNPTKDKIVGMIHEFLFDHNLSMENVALEVAKQLLADVVVSRLEYDEHDLEKIDKQELIELFIEIQELMDIAWDAYRQNLIEIKEIKPKTTKA
jgi:uncharacterized protein YrrD